MRKFAYFLCFLCFMRLGLAGAGFESESYLIWISSSCPTGSTTCTQVAYTQTDKSNGKSVKINGGEPIVGTLSSNLIGYKFYDKKNNYVYELSLDLNNKYTLYIRAFDGKVIGKSFRQEEVKPLKDEAYNSKIKKIKK